MKRALVALLAIGGFGFTGVRDPNSNNPIVFATNSVPITVQQDGSDDVSDGSDIAALQAAIAVWSGPACSNFEFTFAGTTPSRNIASDGTNLITFIESNWPGGASGAAAFAVRRRNTGVSPQVWSEGDIRMNGQEVEWATDQDPQKVDIQSIATHELGHVLGLFHSTEPQATMYFQSTISLTYGRSLHADDIAGLCYLYPAGNFSCQNDGDCPMLLGQYGGNNIRMACSGGSCAPGSVSFGHECFNGGHCDDNTCVGDPIGPPASEPGLCTVSCTVGGSDCPPDTFCTDKPTGSPFCYLSRVDCLDDDDCTSLGNNGRCGIDLDGRYRCRQICLDNTDCTLPNEVCHWGTGASPPGVCRAPGPVANNAACVDSLECQSLTCTGGGANPTCTPYVPGFDPGDAGVIDTGPPIDTGPAPDTGPPVDTGPRPDAGPTPDVGPSPDTGPDLDAGVPQDVGEDPDANLPSFDSGSPLPLNPVGADPVTGGCSCDVQHEGRKSDASWLLCALLFSLLGRRGPSSNERTWRRPTASTTTTRKTRSGGV